MSTALPTTRKVYRRTDNHTPGVSKIEVVEEKLDLPLHPTSVLIKVHAVALNYRDANIANGGKCLTYS
jgi:NADPH:quinone reductase-like Zn-dependent oxidoreductase